MTPDLKLNRVLEGALKRKNRRKIPQCLNSFKMSIFVKSPNKKMSCANGMCYVRKPFVFISSFICLVGLRGKLYMGVIMFFILSKH